MTPGIADTFVLSVFCVSFSMLEMTGKFQQHTNAACIVMKCLSRLQQLAFRMLYLTLSSSRPSSRAQDGSRSGRGGKKGGLQPLVRHLGRWHHCYRAGRAPATHV